tara:strand:+ start:614 stop:874 length:261 start_codon:yes stop_codon:yes gene_type:complete
MSYKNNTDLLQEQLGKKGATVVFTTEAQTEDFYAVHFVTESVISAITITNGTGESALQTTIPAGTVIFANITAITMSSGVAIGYHN